MSCTSPTEDRLSAWCTGSRCSSQADACTMTCVHETGHHSGRTFRLLPVSQLPYPHAPSVCAFEPLFDYQAEALASGRGGRKFIRRVRWLGRRRRRACTYHQHDWRAIGAAAERILSQQGPRPQQVWRAVEASGLPEQERCWLRSLFVDPITIPMQQEEGEYGYVNGQHRACALRFSGWPRAVVSD